MMAWWVLASVGTLLVLLVQGRFAPAALFGGWATGYLVLGVVSEQQWLSSFTNPALITLLVLMLVSLALERSPLLERFAGALLTGSENRASLRLMGVTATLSAFLNNTAVVGTLLSVVSRQRHIPASRLLIPLSFASVLGGVTTLIGTSTNLVVNSFVVSAGLPALGMFEFAAVGVPVALLCLLVVLASRRWLPRHDQQHNEHAQTYFLEARVQPGAALIGRSIEQNRLRSLDGLFLLEIVRNDRLISPVSPDEVLEANDVLVFTGEIEKVQALQPFSGLELFGNGADQLLASNLVEVVVSNESELAKRTLQEVDFRTMFNAGVVGIRRGNKRLTGQLGKIPLRVGDSLLLAVGHDFTQHRNIDRNFHVLGNWQRPKLSHRQSMLAFAGFGAVVALAAFNVLPLLNGLLLLLAALLLSRILTLSELRRRFPFELVIIIGSALTVAKAMDSSGAAQLLANGMRSLFGGYGVFGAFVGVYVMTLLLTETVTNNAAAALAFPVGLSTAYAFGAEPMPFIMAVAFGASACFLVPFGYQTHLMVYSPGRYRMTDFIKTGLPVSLVYSAGVITLVPMVFPF
ncbi:TrkA-C domain-containing protein [Oceanimonas sp. GK1]|uniref:SLC13 family permease n=1 Tax=Oceanimonas sp. (strain GK1 / IBRC-M 10197) TaxID=511062 RepID=UPI000249512C|nr:SLC13 family permease [Oceanimonas sp. GK1]AEY02714.1 TrkA-C domain-containing protein [Oceanimonas sp. GK1]